MNRWRIAIAVCLLVIAGYAIGRWHAGRVDGHQKEISSQTSTRSILRYICPMHPQYTSDRPGDAPCCGMRMVPVYADGQSPASTVSTASSFAVSPEKQLLLGVRFEPADVTPGNQVIRAGARVAYDQRETVLVADVYEYEATALQIGQRALVSRPYPPRREFWATVDFLYPRLDPTSRTLKVRLNAGDIGIKLIPDTFLNVEFRIPGRPVLTVPTQAILNTGLRKVVFVNLGSGQIEPREVETGRSFVGRTEILRGVRRGEPVAVAGTFMLDSESRLKMPPSGGASMAMGANKVSSEPARVNAASGLPMQMDQPSNAPYRDASKMVTNGNPLQTKDTVQIDPVCGMEVDTMNAGLRKSTYAGKTYYFCSTQCKQKFDANPSAYAKPAEPEHASEKEVSDSHTHEAESRANDAVVKAAQTMSPPSLPVLPDEPWNSALAGTGAKHIDPVCGKSVDENNARIRVGPGRSLVREYEGRLLYFCSVACKREFDMNPEFYGRKALGLLESEKPAGVPSAQPKKK
jgi:YHS domain-containing protein